MAKVIGYGHGLSFWGWVKYGVASLVAIPFLVIGLVCVAAYVVIEWSIKFIDELFNRLDWWVRG